MSSSYPMCATCLKESGSGLEIMALSILPLVFFFLTRKWFALDKGKDFWEAVFFLYLKLCLLF